MIARSLVLALAAVPMLWSAAATAGSPFAMVTGSIVAQPMGHYEMCLSQPAECGRTHAANPVVLTEASWSQLDAVNRQVNGAIRGRSDQQIYGAIEVWAFPTTVGDCEDYVLLKRRILAEAGWPLADLLITMVFEPNGGGHALLTVRTSQGDYVLDNLTNEIRIWSDTVYVFAKRQSERDAGLWLSIEGVVNAFGSMNGAPLGSIVGATDIAGAPTTRP